MTCQPNCVLTGSETSPLFKLEDDFLELRHHLAAAEVAEVAAVVLGARVLGVLLGQRCEIAAVLELFLDLLGLSSSVSTRIWRAWTSSSGLISLT